MQSADLIIIGAGPGGYEIAADQAAAGRKVVIIERDALGGTCLNRGCIPTKCLAATASRLLDLYHDAEFGIELPTDAVKVNFDTATQRMHSVMSSLREGIAAMLSQVEVINAEASITPDGNVATSTGQTFTAPQIIIATGSAPAKLPVEGADTALTSDQLLQLTQIPQSLCIVGAGVIGMEFASIFNALGSQVTVVEYCPEVLPPFDTEVAKRLRSFLTRRGVKFHLGAKVEAIDDNGHTVKFTDKRGRTDSVTAELVAMAVGRKPILPQGLQQAGIETTPRGYIKVDQHMQTTRPGVYAVGDVNGLCMLAHAASAQARVAVGHTDVRLDLIPSAVFTIPEAAIVGPTEQALQQQGADYKVAKAVYASSGKALADGHSEGFVKIITDNNGQLLACHVVGAHASDIVAEATAAIYANLTATDLAVNLVHSHPTLSELLPAALHTLA